MSKDWDLFYSEFEIILRKLLGEKNFKKNELIIKEFLEYQKLRMPSFNSTEQTKEFNYNIAEYIFKINSESRVKLKKIKNSIKRINVRKFTDMQEFTKKQVIWGRKSDKIKFDINNDENELKKIVEKEKNKLVDFDASNQYKVNLFDKQNKFEKYSALDIKKNRRLQN